MCAKQVTSQGTPGSRPPCYLMMSTWLPRGNINAMCPKQTSWYAPAHWHLLCSSHLCEWLFLYSSHSRARNHFWLGFFILHSSNHKANPVCPLFQIYLEWDHVSLPLLPLSWPSQLPLTGRTSTMHKPRSACPLLTALQWPVSCWSFNCTCTSASGSTLVPAVGISSALCTVAFRCPSQGFADHPAWNNNTPSLAFLPSLPCFVFPHSTYYLSMHYCFTHAICFTSFPKLPQDYTLHKGGDFVRFAHLSMPRV